MEQKTEFSRLVKEAFKNLEDEEKELKVRLAEIQKQKGPLKTYMQSLGLIEIKKRGPGRKKKVEETA